MCGIAGIISPHEADIQLPLLKKMSDSLAHRGPDGEGFWINPKKTASLAHRRLSILDLSLQAAQPMHFMDRYSIVFNGEIYNYIEIKKELQKAGYIFKSNSDTEVILAAFDCYKAYCLNYFDGMFSFVIWDEYEQSLFAARDRFGEKPFYYFSENNRLIFASEMKALWAAGVEKTPDNKMLLNYMAMGHVQHSSDKSQTFYQHIYSLPPSHYLTFVGGHLQVKPYWSIDPQKTQQADELAAIEKIDGLLSLSVNRRLRSDVPVGTSLSGGLDSSSILHYIMQSAPKNMTTFSAVFPGFEKDESIYIDQTAQYYGVRNIKVKPDVHALIQDFEKMMYHQEEPVSSASAYAQFRVFEAARQQGVKVLLDGQGADEIFAGYQRYVHWYLQELVNRNKLMTCAREKKKLVQNGIYLRWNLKNYLAAYFPSHVAIALEKRSYNQLMHQPDITRDFMMCAKGKEWEGLHKPIVTKLNDILYFDVMEMGLEELLRYADRNAMAHGCEARLPFLQHELVEYVFSLPSQFKIHDGFTKYILRKTMNGKLPDSIVWRKDKVGFEPPQKSWMQDATMQAYMQESKRKLVDMGILKPEVLHKKIKALDAYDKNNHDWRYLSVAAALRG